MKKAHAKELIEIRQAHACELIEIREAHSNTMKGMRKQL